MRPIVSIHNVVHHLGSAKDGFELRIPEAHLPAASTIAVLGESGCGKTSLCLLIGLLAACNIPESFRPTARFRFFFRTESSGTSKDYDIAAAESAGWRDRKHRQQLRRSVISFCPQSLELLWDLSVLQNLEIPLRLNGWTPKARAERVKDVMGSLFGDNWRRLLHQPVSRLSGGEKQRVALGRAFIHRPELIIIDEPTASLNARLASTTLELVTKCARDDGATILMVTHDETLAYRFADFIIRMESTLPADLSEGGAAAFGQISRYERRVESGASGPSDDGNPRWIETNARWQRTSIDAVTDIISTHSQS